MSITRITIYKTNFIMLQEIKMNTEAISIAEIVNEILGEILPFKIEESKNLKDTKKCTKCKQEKKKIDFHKSNSTKDGHRYSCKECQKEIDLKRRGKIKFNEFMEDMR